MNKKIYLLTYHRPINYGAALQAIATYKFLEMQGYDIKLVDYRDDRIEKYRKVIGGRWESCYSFIRNCKSLLRDIFDFNKEFGLRKKFNKFVNDNSTQTSSCNKSNIKEFVNDANTLIVGSDLVWNWEMNKHLNDVFTLEFANDIDCNKISYASSVGSEYIPDDLKHEYESKLKKFNAISVRESSTKILLQNILNRNVECVVDPSLLLNKNEWNKMQNKVELPEHFILIYSLESNEVIDKIVDSLTEINRMPVFYYSKRQKNFKNVESYNYYQYGPSEFLYLIDKADFVITNSFHGTAFSVIYDKSFVTIPHSTRGVRMKDFLSKIDAMDHYCDDFNNFDLTKCKKTIDVHSKEILNGWINESKSFFIDAIGE